MTRQPPNDDRNNNQFDAEFEAIEKAMNSMLQGAFSMMFKQFTESNIFSELESAFPGGFTTVYDGRNLDGRSLSENDSYGGSDFKRLAKKSKENRVQPNDSLVVSNQSNNDELAKHANTSLIFNLLFQPPPAAMFKEKVIRNDSPIDKSNNEQQVK